jgi:hypothetical protein
MTEAILVSKMTKIPLPTTNKKGEGVTPRVMTANDAVDRSRSSTK